MKKSFITTLTVLLATLTAGLSACSKDLTVSYNTTDLEANSVNDSITEYIDDFETSYLYTTTNWNDLRFLNTYEEYAEYGLDLGYTASFFENYKLIIILNTSCSSDGFVFDRVVEKDGTLYPVIKRHYISDGQAVTDDIIFNTFYVEVPLNENYTLGEILYEYY